MTPLDLGVSASLSKMAVAALKYAASGIPVFPAGDSKRPLIVNMLEAATTDAATVINWWSRWPGALIGVPTGKRLGAIVIDVDVKEGRDGIQELKRLEAIIGALPRCPVRDGNGGKQLFFSVPEGMRIKSRASQVAPGVDVRGCQADGSAAGFVIVPPSCRPGKEANSWEGDSEARVLNKDFPPLPPDWLLQVAFNIREREALSALGIRRAADFGAVQPPAWQAEFERRCRDRQIAALSPELRKGMIGPNGSLAEYAKTRIERYVTCAIEAELRGIQAAEPGSQEPTLNEAGLKVHSLLMGAEVLGMNVRALRAAVSAKYVEAVCAMTAGDPLNPWTAEHANAKWEHTAADASPRELAHTLNHDRHFEAVPVAFDTAQIKPQLRLFRDRIKPLGLTYDNLTEIPPRAWLADRKLMRKKLSLLVAAGAAGKSSISIQWAIALALGDGRQFGLTVRERVRVLLVNLEDEMAEQKRRVAAVCLRFGIDPASLDGWLDVYEGHGEDDDDDGRGEADDFIVMCRNKDKLLTRTATVQELIEYAREKSIGAIIVDPLTETHSANENDNDEIKLVAKTYRHVARAADAAVLLIHHMKKGSGADRASRAGDIDSGRGAGALSAMARVGMTLAGMSNEEARDFDVRPADRVSYVRLDDGAKANLSRRSDVPEWFRWESLRLPNADEIGVLVPARLTKGRGAGNLRMKALAYIIERADAGTPVATARSGVNSAGYFLSEKNPDLAPLKDWHKAVDDLAVNSLTETGKNKRGKDIWLPTEAGREEHARYYTLHTPHTQCALQRSV